MNKAQKTAVTAFLGTSGAQGAAIASDDWRVQVTALILQVLSGCFMAWVSARN